MFELSPGERVADFVVEGPLGKGGMASVYRARDPLLGRAVALKLVDPLALGAEGLIRFRREAELVARVDGLGGVVRVHARGEHRGAPFLVLELVEGRDLAAVLDAGRIEAARLARIIERVAITLDRCHRAGVVHRDLKPSNILVRAMDDEPLLADFGLARDLTAQRMTETGIILGTPGYMAPEQALDAARAFDPLIDVYALGAILYRGLSGRTPFGVGQGAMVRALHEDPPPPSSWGESVDPRLETICMRALSRDPGSRQSSAAELAEELAGWRRGVAAPRRSPRLTRASAAAAVVGAALLLLSGSAWSALRSADPVPVQAHSPTRRPGGPRGAGLAAVDSRPDASPRPAASEPSGTPTTYELLRAGAGDGDPQMMFGLAAILWTGEGCPQDREASARWMLPAAEEGHRDAMYRVGRMYRQGKGQPRDPVRAAKWFEQALLTDHAGAAAELAGMLLLGEGIERDVDRAWRLGVKGARAGFSEGVETLEQLRTRGEGSAEARAEGEMWLQQAELDRLLPRGSESDLTTGAVLRREVEADNPSATYALAMLLQGEGMTKDRVAAARWMRRSADRGHPDAMFQLGEWHCQPNKGVEIDLPLAVAWYEKALQRGHLRAGARLAKLLLRGQGVAKDVDRAWTLALAGCGQGRPPGRIRGGLRAAEGRGRVGRAPGRGRRVPPCGGYPGKRPGPGRARA